MTGFGCWFGALSALGWVSRWGLSHFGLHDLKGLLQRFCDSLLWCEHTSQEKAGILQNSVQNPQVSISLSRVLLSHSSSIPFKLGRRIWKQNLAVTQSQRKQKRDGHEHRSCCGAGIIVRISAGGFQLWLWTIYWTLKLLQRIREFSSPEGLLRTLSPAERVGLHLPRVCQAFGSTTCWTSTISSVSPFQVKIPHCQQI